MKSHVRGAPIFHRLGWMALPMYFRAHRCEMIGRASFGSKGSTSAFHGKACFAGHVETYGVIDNKSVEDLLAIGVS